MKVSKKFLSMLLVVAMVLSFSVISASAEPAVIINGVSNSADGDQPDAIVTYAQQDEDQSGETGSDKTADEVKDTQVEDTEVENPEAVIIGSEKTYKYATLKEAIAAAREGATIQVADDITFSDTLYINKSVKIYLDANVLTFKNSGDVVSNALVIEDDASVTISSGEIVFEDYTDDEGESYGFVNGFVAEDGSLVLNEVNITGSLVGGTPFSGDVRLKDSVSEFDPSGFVADGYKVMDLDGTYAVVEDDYPEDDGPSTFIIVPGKTYKLEDDSDLEALELPENITEDMTIDLGAFTLTPGEDVTFTVAKGVKLTITGNDGTFKGDITLNGGKLVIEGNVTVDGNIVMGNDSSLYVSSSDVTVTGEVKLAKDADAKTISGSVTAGTFNGTDKNLLKQLLSPSHHFNGDKVELNISTAENQVIDANGKKYDTEDNYLQYFKGETELAAGQDIVFAHEAVFVLTSLSDSNTVSIKIDNGDDLSSPTDYTIDSATKVLKFVTETQAAGKDGDKTQIIVPVFDDLSAGAHKIVFTFAEGTPKTVTIDMFVWPSVVYTDYEYTQGGTDDYTVEVSDKPDQVWLNGTILSTGAWTYDTTTDPGKNFVVIYAETMNGLTVGDVTVSLVYEDTNHPKDPAQFQAVITIKAAPSLTPVEANKDNKWYNSDTALSYNAPANVDTVSVDGNKLTKDTDYSISDTNILSLKPAFLKKLGYGEHTLAVTTKDGTTLTVKFTTAPSLVAGKNGSNHTKGGSKDLIFVASDPMNAVWVGKTQLKSDYYTISDDGKTITLKAAFLNTLKADNTYTITTAWLNSDGTTAKYSAATSFKILSATSAGATPKTGDTGVGLWVALLVMSGAAMAVIIPKRKEN